MKQLRWLSVAAALMLLLSAGCAMVARRPELPPANPEALAQSLENQRARLTRYQARVDVTLKTPDYAGALFGVVQVDRDRNAFHARLSLPMGFPAAEVTLAGDRYEVVLGDGRVFAGEVQQFNPDYVLGLPLPTDDLLTLFDPQPRPPDEMMTTVHFHVDSLSGVWTWGMERATLSRTLEYDSEARAVALERWIPPGSLSVLEKSYSHWEWEGGVRYASRVLLQLRGLRSAKAAVHFRSLDPDPDWDGDEFDLKMETAP